jgi:hypothetical protein
VIGRRVLVGVTVGAGVDVGAYGVAVGNLVGTGVVGLKVGAGVLVSAMGNGVGAGVGADVVTMLVTPQLPAATQAAKAAPTSVRLESAAQSGGMDICASADCISAADWKRRTGSLASAFITISFSRGGVE